MSRLLPAFVIATLLCVSSVASDDSGLSLKITKLSRQGKVTVQLFNTMSHSARVWKDSNSWGAAHWRFLVIRKGHLNIYFENPAREFTRNIPAFEEIRPGKSIKHEIDIASGEWRSSSAKGVELEPDDTVVIIYDVPFTPEAERMNVWYGVAGSCETVR